MCVTAAGGRRGRAEGMRRCPPWPDPHLQGHVYRVAAEAMRRRAPGGACATTTARPPMTQQDYDDLYELDLDSMTNFNITENASIQLVFFEN